MTGEAIIAIASRSPVPRALPTTSPAVLYEEHRGRVYHLCLRLGAGNVAWAEDATQDVFVKLLAELPRLSASEDLGGWIYRVTVNTCLSRLRREGSVWRRVLAALAARPASTAPSPERQLSLREDAAAALEELERLPAKERVVFCMKHLDGLDQRSIAASLGHSEGYISKLLDRARARIEERGWEAPHD